jgi:hypothetical protein
MASGIDTKIDRIYSNEGTEWHQLAIVKETITREEIKETLFPIAQSPAMVSIDGINITLDNHKVICADLRGLRDDLAENERIVPLHIPKAGYQVIDNGQVWEAMEKSLKDLDAVVTSVGTLEAGKKFFISTNIGDSEMVINKDKFKFFLNFVTSHDGTIAMNAYDSSIRIVCMNTLRWSMQAQGDVNFKIMHTKNADLAMVNLPDLVNAILKGRADLKEVMEYLETCKVDQNDALAMASGYFAITTNNDINLSARSMNAATEIATLFGRGIGCKGETLYDLANGATEYWTSGEGTGKKGTTGSRLYRSSMGSAADHKEAFVALLADEDRRKTALALGKEALKNYASKS